MNEPGGFQRYNEAMSRRYVIGGAGPVFSFASDAFPTVPVSDDQIDFEMRYLAGVRSYAGYRQMAALAANFTITTLANPSTSSVLVHVESGYITNGANAAEIWSGVAASILAPGTSQIGCTRDTRTSLVATGSSVCRMGTLQQAASPANSTLLFGTFLAANASWDFTNQLPVVIQPGTTFWMMNTVLNSSYYISWNWRERVFNPNELG